MGLSRFNGFQNGVVRHLGFIGTASPPHVVLDAGYSYACQDVASYACLCTSRPRALYKRLNRSSYRLGAMVKMFGINRGFCRLFVAVFTKIFRAQFVTHSVYALLWKYA